MGETDRFNDNSPTFSNFAMPSHFTLSLVKSWSSFIDFLAGWKVRTKTILLLQCMCRLTTSSRRNGCGGGARNPARQVQKFSKSTSCPMRPLQRSRFAQAGSRHAIDFGLNTPKYERKQHNQFLRWRLEQNLTSFTWLVKLSFRAF